MKDWKPLLFTGLFSLLIIWQASAQETLTPELIWSLGQPVLCDASPDGNWALYGITYYDRSSNSRQTDLYRIHIDGRDKGVPQQLTITSADESLAQYGPEGKTIYYLRDELFWKMNADGTGAVRISEIPMTYFRVSPDGKRIAYLTADPNDLKSGKRRQKRNQFHNLQKTPFSPQLFIAELQQNNLENPTRIEHKGYRQPAQIRAHTQPFSWSFDSQKLIFTALPATTATEAAHTDVLVYDMATDACRLISSDMPGPDYEPTFSPTGRYVAWVSQEDPHYEADRRRIFVSDMRNGEKWEMTTGLEREARHPRWYQNDARFFFIGTHLGAWQLFEVNFQKGGKLRPRTNGFGSYRHFVFAGDLMIASRTFLTQPDELYRLPLGMGMPRQFTSTNESVLDSLALPKLVRRAVKTNDGELMSTLVLQPPGFKKDSLYPALLYCPDGPHAGSYHDWQYVWNMPLLAAQGYVVILPARRGLRTHGTDWARAATGDWGGKAMADLYAAADTFSKKPFIDPARIGAIGKGFGGYSVYWMAGKHPEMFKALVSSAGIFNLESWRANTPAKSFAQYELGKKSYAQSDSPHLWVDQWRSPMLIIEDPSIKRVPRSETQEAYKQARKQGVEVKYLKLEESEDLSENPREGIQFQQSLLEWLDKYLK